MGTAFAQDLHHLSAILHRIEMGLHGLRLRRDLAQRQRSRENFDENYLHERHEKHPVSPNFLQPLFSFIPSFSV
jgi:hypothetical protein